MSRDLAVVEPNSPPFSCRMDEEHLENKFSFWKNWKKYIFLNKKTHFKDLYFGAKKKFLAKNAKKKKPRPSFQEAEDNAQIIKSKNCIILIKKRRTRWAKVIRSINFNN